ncbi:hypothetical protein FXO38_08291 [Capsicum annuum]|nr:hypothetical protein FXO38_08291 [Capsicum annuum]
MRKVAGDNTVIEEKEKELLPEATAVDAPRKEEVKNVEREIKDVKTVGQDEKEEKSIVNEELAAPEAKGVETSEVTENVSELEIASSDIRPITENGSTKDDTSPTTETNEVAEVHKREAHSSKPQIHQKMHACSETRIKQE